MEKISAAKIENLVLRFSNRTLSKSEWNHHAHIIVGIWHNMNYNLDKAIELIRSKIKSYNSAVGTLNTDKAGYHETLTIFWMVLSKSFLLRHPSLLIEDAIHLFMQSELSSKEYPLEFYTKDLLMDMKAREGWVNGDLRRISLLSFDTKIEDHFSFSDDQFEREFRDCTLPPSLFNHEAHLRLAWIHIQKYGIEKAVKNIQKELQEYVAFVGAKDKYHSTLTVSAIRAVDHFVSKSKISSFKEFITAYPQLRNNFKSLIESHYSFNVFNSEKAKREYLEPDLQSFKFNSSN